MLEVMFSAAVANCCCLLDGKHGISGGSSSSSNIPSSDSSNSSSKPPCSLSAACSTLALPLPARFPLPPARLLHPHLDETPRLFSRPYPPHCPVLLPWCAAFEISKLCFLGRPAWSTSAAVRSYNPCGIDGGKGRVGWLGARAARR